MLISGFLKFHLTPSLCKRVIAISGLVFSLGMGSVYAAQEIPRELQPAKIEERLGNSIQLSTRFKNEKGEEVTLARYFNQGRPVVLNLIYYECPTLCSFVLNGFLESLKRFKWTPGREFEIVTVSIDPRENADLAMAKKEAYFEEYEARNKRPGAKKGWHFLTGEESQIKKLANDVGFGYVYDKETKQYGHSAALMILTPDGKVSRYLHGISYPVRDMRLALLEASNGKIGTIADRILMFCYRYDPNARGYSLYAWRLMRAGGAGTVVIMGGYLFVFWRRQRKEALVEDDNTSS